MHLDRLEIRPNLKWKEKRKKVKDTSWLVPGVLIGINMGDMWLAHRAEHSGVIVYLKGMESGKSMGRVWVASKEGAKCDLGHVGLGWMWEQGE